MTQPQIAGAATVESYLHVGVDGAVSDLTVVPVANTRTCGPLLHMAGLLTGREGTIIAAVVHTSDERSERAEAVVALVEQIAARDTRVELVEINASTVARGVLDVARDRYADLILLGVTGRVDKGDGPLGSIGRDIVTAAGCDVMLLRPTSDAIPSITIASGGQARHVADLLGDRLGVPVAASGANQGILSLPHLLPTRREEPPSGSLHVVEAEPPGTGAWSIGEEAVDAMATDGPVLVVARHPYGNPIARAFRRVVPRLTIGEQQRLITATRASARVSFDYVLLCIVSALLASFGLLADSAAVVIGAMLVAPLLGPLSAFGVGLATANLPKMRLAARTTLVGSGVVFLTAYLVGLFTTGGEPTGELAARGAPTILDGGVALASGVVGAYATARKDIPAALAGVAIAAALVPPICAAGIGFADGHGPLALGATLLFVTNIVCIAAIAALTFEVLGVTTGENEQPTVQRIATVVAVLAVCIAVWLAGRTGQGIDEDAIHDVLVEAVAEQTTGQASIVSVNISGGGDPVVTAVAVGGDIDEMDADAIESRLQDATGLELELRLATLPSD